MDAERRVQFDFTNVRACNIAHGPSVPVLDGYSPARIYFLLYYLWQIEKLLLDGCYIADVFYKANKFTAKEFLLSTGVGWSCVPRPLKVPWVPGCVWESY